MSEQPRKRITWVPRIADPTAPTAAEFAAGVPLDGYEVLDDGLQIARDTAEPPPALPAYVSFYLEPREPDWIVFRAADDLPPGVMPAALDGLWINRPPAYVRDIVGPDDGIPFAVFVPTGRFEVREDGAVAEVWEMRP